MTVRCPSPFAPLLLLASLLLPSGASAQDPPLRIPRLAEPIRLDGVVDEAAWTGSEPMGMTMFQPTAGAPPVQRTEFWLAYDDDYIYAAGRMYVSDLRHIRANSLTRDRLNGDDVFRVMFDTFNDGENGMLFGVTPAGVRVDAAIAGDGQRLNFDWNAHWDAATAATADGWTAEIRIPLSTLRFRADQPEVVMGLLAARTAHAGPWIDTHPAVSPQHANAIYKVSLARKVSFAGIRSRSPLYVSPYVIGGASRSQQLNAARNAFGPVDRSTREIGGDLKYGLTSDLVLDVTVNTDFAQAEADDQQVNLGRFSLFFPEKRQFFQERGGLFDFVTGGSGDGSRLFHSRRIGLTDGGAPIGIHGGARLVGQAGRWELGALTMQTESAGDTPSENFGVVRARRALARPNTYIGGIVTSRVGFRPGADNPYNVAWGLDAQLRTAANDYLVLQWAHVLDDDGEAGLGRAGMARAVYERRSSAGLGYRLAGKWSGPDHLPELGFQPRSDYHAVDANLRYGWFPGQATMFQNVTVGATGLAFRRNGDDEVESAFLGPYLSATTKRGWNASLGVDLQHEVLLATLPLAAGVSVPAGAHDFTTFQFQVNPPQGRRLRMGAAVSTGTFYDGTRTEVAIYPTWNASRHFEVQGLYSRQVIRFADRDMAFDPDLIRLRVTAAANIRLSAAVFVQYNRAADLVVGNARIRYHLGEGRDFYLVYNDRLNQDRDRFTPALPRLPGSAERTLLFKYSHSFVP